MGLRNQDRADCRAIRALLEDPAAADRGVRSFADMLAVAPPALIKHAENCRRCREAGENLLASRAVLSSLASRADLGGAWFPSRVMAAIAARKAELARVADTWTFLPKLASRLTWASSVALLLASAWLYQRPVSTIPAQPVVTDITGEPIVDKAAPAATDDEVLLSLAEKDQKPQ
jgi:hypothetical protein